SFKLFGLQLDIFALADFVAFDDVGSLDLVAGVGIDLAIPDPVAGVLIELMKADFLSPRRSREQRYGTGNQRELQIAFPIRTRGHRFTPISVRGFNRARARKFLVSGARGNHPPLRRRPPKRLAARVISLPNLSGTPLLMHLPAKRLPAT